MSGRTRTPLFRGGCPCPNVLSGAGRRPMTGQRRSLREVAWIVPGDAEATLANLTATMDLDQLDPVDRIRAIFIVRHLLTIADDAGRERAADLLHRLDPTGSVPEEPDIIAVRVWLELHLRYQARGALGRLARSAGLPPPDLSKLRAGRSLTAAKRETLGAALIHAGVLKLTGRSK